MKNIIASTGLVALGIAGLQPTTETNADPNPTTPWSISASLRGFYDDNITTLPDKYVIGYGQKIVGYETIRSEDNSFVEDPTKPIYASDLEKPIYGKQSSYGISFSPSVNFNAVREQGEIGLGYTFGLKWYEDRDPDSTDESHTIAAKIAHSVSPTLSFELANNLRIAQEPEIIAGTVRRAEVVVDPGTGAIRTIRGEQDYLHNQASFYATQMLSDTYSVYAGYANTVFNFDDPDFSRHLDRVEHTPLIHLKAQLKPNTVGLIGYRFKAVDYPDDEVLVPGDPRFGRETLNSDVRDSDSHYVYAGLDHAFTPTLQGSVRLGAQFTKFVNADENPNSTIDDATNPFADANLSYGYAEGSHLQIGVKHERNRHDLAFTPDVVADNPILDQEQTVVYASVHHQLTAKLNASLVGHYLNGTYEGGGPTVDGQNDEYWAFGISLDYAINPYLAAEAGYNFDDYESGVLSEFRSYDRNRVYVGLRASY